MNTRQYTRSLALGIMLAAALHAQAATTDLADKPLITDPTAAVLPNVFLVLDDSLTMQSDYMPFQAINFEGGEYGIASSHCNGVYYNPGIRYIPPIHADGSSYPNSDFNAAWINGFKTTDGVVDLRTNFIDANVGYTTPHDRTADPAQTAFYYVYSGLQNTDLQQDYYYYYGLPADILPSVFFNECNSAVGSTALVDGANPVNTLFTKITVSSATASYTKGIARTDCAGASCTFAEESQNFANWFSYYRSRMLTMKTATGLAFRSIGNGFRLGFATVNNNNHTDFLGLGQFDVTQKSVWYTKLYDAVPGQTSPLREVLANVGKMYAGRLTTFNTVDVEDPIQYSCQQNFTILTSDGSWNGNAATQLDNTTAIGNQDGDEPRPMFDGSYRLRSTSHTTEAQTETVMTTSNIQRWTEQNQTQTSRLQNRTGALQWRTSQQKTVRRLDWRTNLQNTTATLQWQTNLQDTRAILQWQTNLQHIDAPLQWRTNLQQTIQQQLWSTDQQQTTAPLQWQTKQQRTTAPLLWATNLQSTTSALQWRTNLQATSGTLQQRTSQLQRQVTQLQRRTSTLQEQISQLQSSTSTLQGSTMYLQTRVSSNSGIDWSGWSNTASCTWLRGIDGTWRDCRYVTAAGGNTLWTAAGGTWTNPASCTSSFDATTASGGTPPAGTVLPGNGTSCRYTAWTAYANASSCTALPQSAAPNYTVATATQCQNVVNTAYHNVASCTATTIPNGSGQTTQCQYTAWSGWSGAATCTALAQSTSPNYTVGTATACQSLVTTAWTNAASCTEDSSPDASGYTTQCQYLPFSGWITVISGNTCAPLAQSASPNYVVGVASQCQLLSPTTAYVTSNPPSCAVTYNAGGTSTAGAGGISTSACSNTAGTYSAWANVGGSNSCSTVSGTGPSGSSTQCQMAAAAPTYFAYGASCPAVNLYTAGGNSTANAAGNVTLCSTAGTFSTPIPLSGTQNCLGSGANVQCSTGTPTTAYVTYAAPTCTTTYNGAEADSSAIGGLVVTACPVNAAWSGVTPLAAGQTCTGNGTTIQCPTGGTTTAYVSYAVASAGSCAVDYYGLSGSSTAGTGGIVTTACPTAAWTPPAAIATCAASAHVACSLGTGVTDYVGTYPPECTLANNGGLVTTACTLNAAFGPALTIGAGNTCTGGTRAAGTPTWGNTVECVTGTPLAAAYVNTYAPTCSVGYNGVSGSSLANGSGNVITSCPVNASYGTAHDVAAGNTCNGALANVRCIATASATTNRVTTYPPACAIDFNASGTSTAGPGGIVITACPTTTFGGGGDIGANNICNGALPNVQCIATSNVATARVATYPPTCAVDFNASGSSTANGSGTVITACSTTTFGGGGNIGAGNTCDGTLPNVQCVATAGGTGTTYISTYPPTCSTTFSAAGTSLADGSGYVITACPISGTYDSWRNTTVANVSCTPSATVSCRYNWGGWNIAGGNCTDNFSSGTGVWSIRTGTSCRYSNLTSDATPTYSAWSNYLSATCTTVPQSAGPLYTTLTARNCQVVNANTTPANTPAWPSQAWLPASSCAANAPAFNGSGQRINCQTVTAGPTPVAAASCVAGTLGVSPWTTTTCVNNTVVAAHGVASCTPSYDPLTYRTTSCVTTTTPGVPAAGCVAEAANAGNGWTATFCSAPSGGTYDTLADVAEYYYKTDLRNATLWGNQLTAAPGVVNGTDVSYGNVPTTGTDTNSEQHMTTFTLGLGARGRMVFDPNYQSVLANTSNTTGSDFYSLGHEPPELADGAGVCSWQAAGSTCDWPIPAVDTLEDIDDLWHAAVNGRGTYFSAKNPSDLGVGLTSALANIQSRLGSAAASTTSSPFITPTDNYEFASTYVSLHWTGELIQHQLDPATGNALSTVDWSAQAKLDGNTSRVIYTYDQFNANNGGGTNKLKPFVYANLTATEQGYFNLTALHASGSRLAQFANTTPPAETCASDLICMDETDEANASGANLVNFIRGDRSNEGDISNGTKYFRQRQHILGDIVSSAAAYVKVPPASFSDPGFSDHKTAQASRLAMVYVGANDGMLHAFRSLDVSATVVDEGGQEDWAYIPNMVMPDLFHLADKHYDENHRFYVDGTPVAADVCVLNCNDLGTILVPSTAVWKTILVGGLNHGGRGYYALDVTDPASPKALWEFSNNNMGYTYGNPKVVKLADGTWVVLVTSGYNNVPPYAPSGDGRGHLYVLNAGTGALIRDIDTGAGSTTAPSGLARIEAPVSTPGIDATVVAVYGGDLDGNLWRFDVNNNVGAAGYDAQLIATLRDASNNAQPITVAPIVTEASGRILVHIGTGRYLGAVDQNSVPQDSFYTIMDPYSTSSTPSIAIYGDPRTEGTFVEQTISCPVAASQCANGGSSYESSNLTVNYSSHSGWYTDFPQLGERNNIDPKVQLGTLVIDTNLPSSSSCTIGGKSYQYFLNYRTGGAVNSNGSVGGWLADQLSVGSNIIMLADGRSLVRTQLSGGSQTSSEVPLNGSADGTARRVSWRELIVQ